MIFFLMLAAALPGLYWDQGPETAPQLKAAGIECVHVASPDAWKSSGFCAAPADLGAYEKLPQPGVDFRPDVARATSAPWVNSNAWRLLRATGRPVYYDAVKGNPELCAAEAFVYGAPALVRVDPSGLDRLAAMLRFLKSVDAPPLPARANIGFIDDGSAQAGEVMNLMTRRNLLFRVVTAPDRSLDLNVKAVPGNPSEFVAGLRRQLGDEKRLLRIYGSEVVIGRLTGDASHARLHLLNYSGKRLEGLRVRVLGAYKKAQLSAPGGGAASDFLSAGGATEFSLPALDTYAVIDLK